MTLGLDTLFHIYSFTEIFAFVHVHWPSMPAKICPTQRYVSTLKSFKRGQEHFYIPFPTHFMERLTQNPLVNRSS